MKPRLTKRVVRGLSRVNVFLDASAVLDSDLYVGCETASDKAEIDAALTWLASLVAWSAKRPKPGPNTPRRYSKEIRKSGRQV